jgi:hypothetical protein
MQISKKAGLPLNPSALAGCVFLICLCLAGAQAPTNHPVSHLIHRPPLDLSRNPRSQALVDATMSQTKQAQFTPTNAEVVAWSVKTDDLGIPPRLFEDAVVLVNVVSREGTNKWILSYMCRMASGALKGPDWGQPHYPPLCKPPVATYAEFSRKPSEHEIAEFIRASDFAYNSFVPRMRVLNVTVFRESVEIERTIQDSISAEERCRRYLEDQRCFLEERPAVR